jgi:hypothetical protein
MTRLFTYALLLVGTMHTELEFGTTCARPRLALMTEPVDP